MQPISTSVRQSQAGRFTRRELQEYLGVGRNAVPGIADRFKLACIDGSHDEREVWRRLLGLEAVGDTGVISCGWAQATFTGFPASSARPHRQSGTSSRPGSSHTDMGCNSAFKLSAEGHACVAGARLSSTPHGVVSLSPAFAKLRPSQGNLTTLGCLRSAMTAEDLRPPSSPQCHPSWVQP